MIGMATRNFWKCFFSPDVWVQQPPYFNQSKLTNCLGCKSWQDLLPLSGPQILLGLRTQPIDIFGQGGSGYFTGVQNCRESKTIFI